MNGAGIVVSGKSLPRGAGEDLLPEAVVVVGAEDPARGGLVVVVVLPDCCCR